MRLPFHDFKCVSMHHIYSLSDNMNPSLDINPSNICAGRSIFSTMQEECKLFVRSASQVISCSTNYLANNGICWWWSQCHCFRSCAIVSSIFHCGGVCLAYNIYPIDSSLSTAGPGHKTPRIYSKIAREKLENNPLQTYKKLARKPSLITFPPNYLA